MRNVLKFHNTARSWCLVISFAAGPKSKRVFYEVEVLKMLAMKGLNGFESAEEIKS